MSAHVTGGALEGKEVGDVRAFFLRQPPNLLVKETVACWIAQTFGTAGKA
jgi:hypothetical protein